MQSRNFGLLCCLVAVLATPAARAAEPSAESGDLVTAYRACHALAQVRGIRTPLLSSMLGDKAAFQQIADRTTLLVQSPVVRASPSVMQVTSRIRRNSELLVSKQEVVLKTHDALRSIRKAAPELLREAEDLMVAELTADAPPQRVSAANQLVMLTQRIGKSAAEMSTIDGVDPESVFLLGKDPKSFITLAKALRDGNTELRLTPAKGANPKQRLTNLLQKFEPTRLDSEALLSTLQDLVAAREAQAKLLADTLALERVLDPHCQSMAQQ
ncbi:MAG: hypothetical protein ABW190_06120 [Rhizobacter sp.]